MLQKNPMDTDCSSTTRWIVNHAGSERKPSIDQMDSIKCASLVAKKAKSNVTGTRATNLSDFLLKVLWLPHLGRKFLGTDQFRKCHLLWNKNHPCAAIVDPKSQSTTSAKGKLLRFYANVSELSKVLIERDYRHVFGRRSRSD